jgi:hypothetical protein
MGDSFFRLHAIRRSKTPASQVALVGLVVPVYFMTVPYHLHTGIITNVQHLMPMLTIFFIFFFCSLKMFIFGRFSFPYNEVEGNVRRQIIANDKKGYF